MSRRTSCRSRRFAAPPSAPAAWTPANLSLFFWANSQAANVTKDGSNLVSQMNDLASGNHLVQATGANQPTWTTDGMATGVDAIRINSNNSSMRLAKTALAAMTETALTVFCTVRVGTAPSVGGSCRPMMHMINTERAGWHVRVENSSGTLQRRFSFVDAAGTQTQAIWGTYTAGTDEYWVIQLAASGGAGTAPDTVSFRVNGAAVSPSFNALAWADIGASSIITALGNYTSVTTPDWRIGELGYRRSVLTAGELTALETYLAARI